MRINKANKASGDYFIDFLNRNFSNNTVIALAAKNENAKEDINFKIAKSKNKPLRIEFKEKPRLESISLKNILPLISDKDTISNFDVADEMAAQWLNTYLEEKERLLSDAKQRRGFKKVKVPIHSLNIKKHLRQKNNNFFYPGMMIKPAYTLLAVMILSTFLAFQKTPSNIMVNFFDSLILSPFKLISTQHPDFYSASVNEKSNYIKDNYVGLQEKQEKDIRSVKINPADLKGIVAGVSESSLPEKESFLSSFISKLAAKQRNLSLAMSDKLSEMLKNR